uniref:Uncharacterized protein n=1 Tax=Kalanchoe fedtschenkoi TaxID=63787 RepID=A0A7N0VAJ3_KALFE
MREAARRNTVRSAIVVLVAAASSYLTWRLIAVPFMEKAQIAFERSEAPPPPTDDDSRLADDDWEVSESNSSEAKLTLVLILGVSCKSTMVALASSTVPIKLILAGWKPWKTKHSYMRMVAAYVASGGKKN